jgi:hypothetical protein
MLFQLLSSGWYCVQLICAALIIMETVTPLQFARLLETVLLESPDMSDTDTEDTVTSPPQLFPARVQQQVLQPAHAQVRPSRQRMHADSNGH